jgi:hypothetical protein
MPQRQTSSGAQIAEPPSSTRVVSRDSASKPLSVAIQVERLRVSEQQRSSVTAALNEGRKSAGKTD